MSLCAHVQHLSARGGLGNLSDRQQLTAGVSYPLPSPMQLVQGTISGGLPHWGQVSGDIVSQY